MTYIGAPLHLRFNEPQEMLLVHTAGMMDMRIDLPQVVKIPANQSEP